MKIDYEKELNSSQLAAVKATEGPVLVLAGAGSGKTRTLIYRVCYLMEKGVAPESILLLTFTNKAAREMQERAEQMLGKKAKRITACTYHSFCTRMLRKYAFCADLLQRFTVLSGDDPATIIHMMEAELGYEELTEFPSSKQIASMISTSVNHDIPLNMAIRRFYPKAERYVREIEKIRERAEKYKKENHLLDYDDLMIRFYQLLIDRPDIAEEIDEDFRYICIDEFQDTNPLQAKIINAIRKKYRNLMVVGDDYQSIYRFRGSDVRIIQNFPDTYPGAQVIFLTENYRSTPQIVNFANCVMEEHALDVRYKKTLVSKTEDGNMPMLVYTKTQEKEANLIATNIEKLHENGKGYGNIMILARNSASTVPVEAELTKRGIPYEKRGGPKFFDKPHVRDMLAFIRILNNPKDELSWFRILQILPRVGEATAREIAAYLREHGIEGLQSEAYAGTPYEEGLHAIYRILHEVKAKDKVSEILVELKGFYITQKQAVVVAKATDMDTKREELAKIGKESADLSLLVQVGSDCSSTVDFLDNLAFDMSASEDGNISVEKKNEPEDRVVISTIHSAKGLEFEVVYILDAVDGIFPSTDFRFVGTSEDQEELRCMYVAVTRAKKTLFMFSPTFCKTRRGMQKSYPSHFLERTDRAVTAIAR